jgi:hypothetical protein
MLGHGTHDLELFALVIPLWGEHFLNRGCLEEDAPLEHPCAGYLDHPF